MDAWDGMGRHVMAWGGIGWHGVAWDSMGRHGMAWDDMGWMHGMTWGGMGWHGVDAWDGCIGWIHGMTWGGCLGCMGWHGIITYYVQDHVEEEFNGYNFWHLPPPPLEVEAAAAPPADRPGSGITSLLQRPLTPRSSETAADDIDLETGIGGATLALAVATPTIAAASVASVPGEHAAGSNV